MFHLDPHPPRAPNVVVANTESKVIEPESQAEHEMIQRLDYETWLPFAAKVYEISPDINDYILVTTPICPADIPNRNGIGFPLAELTAFQPPPVSRQAYKAWTGTPVHYEHKNEIHKDAYGVILDSSFHKISGYGRGKLWKVMGVLAIDKKKYPQMADRVLRNEINTYSMGSLADQFTCSYCGTVINKKSCCSHINPMREEDDPRYNPDDAVNWKVINDYDGSQHVAFLNAHGLSPIETSLVESPAWTTALSDHILTR